MGNCLVKRKDKNLSIIELTTQSSPLEFYQFQTLRYGIELDMMIGSLYWKVFLSNKFWSNISTPLNLALTFMTALIAAKASTGSSFISEDTSMQLSFASLIITTVNSFFQPQKKEQKTNELLATIIAIGHRFEVIYWGPEPYTKKVEAFKSINEELCKYKCEVYIKDSNFFTEIIWWVTQQILKKDGKTVGWLDGRDKQVYIDTGYNVLKSKEQVQELESNRKDEMNISIENPLKEN